MESFDSEKRFPFRAGEADPKGCDRRKGLHGMVASSENLGPCLPGIPKSDVNRIEAVPGRLRLDEPKAFLIGESADSRVELSGRGNDVGERKTAGGEKHRPEEEESRRIKRLEAVHGKRG